MGDKGGKKDKDKKKKHMINRSKRNRASNRNQNPSSIKKD